MSTHHSFCRLCLNGCALQVEVEDGVAISVRGDKGNPVYKGFTCVKGRHQPHLLAHPDRLLHSLKRTPSGNFETISVERAIGEIADRLGGLLAAHGPRSVAGYLGTNFAAAVPTMPLFASFMQAIGTPMIFSPGTIDKPGKKIAQALHGDWRAPAVGFDDPEVILLLGINPLITFTGFPYGNPGKWLSERLSAGTRLIVVDPRRSDVAKRADLHLQPVPGEDVAIVAALLHVVLAERLYDTAFVAAHTRGMDALERSVAAFSPDRVAARVGVPAADLVAAARWLGSTRRGYIMAGTGPNMSGAGTLIEYLLLNLQTLCGYWLREGDRVRHPGALAAPLKAHAQVIPPYPAYGFGEKLRVRGLANTAAGMPTAALADEILMPGEGQVRALLSVAGNPVGAWPDQAKTIEAMRALDLLVQIDPWMSATARLADYVIAPQLWLEVAGTTQILDWLTRNGTGYGQADPYAQYTPAIVDPPSGSDVIEEWQFFYELARKMGLQLSASAQLGPDMPVFPLDMNQRPATEDLLEMLSEGSRVVLSEVKANPGGAIYTDPELRVGPCEDGATARFELADGAMIEALDQVANRDPVGSDFPYRLVCRRMMHVYNSSFVGSLPAGTRPYNPVFMHPDDIASLGLDEGDMVEVRSAKDGIPGLVHADASLRQGIVSMSFGFGGLPDQDDQVSSIGSNTARLLSNDLVFDPFSGQPLMTNIPVSVAKKPTAKSCLTGPSDNSCQD